MTLFIENYIEVTRMKSKYKNSPSMAIYKSANQS